MPGTSLDHVSVVAADFDRSLAFYDAALGALGLTRHVDLGDEEEDDAPVEVAAWGDPPALWLLAGTPATTGAHVALVAPDAASVDRFHAAALAAGGRSLRAPRPWAIYRPGYFGAVVLDPAGNRIEALTRSDA